ncbi:MAG: DNA translocase FtsK [Lachnospiraceae bacterium]|nr:DNA translocase FtsK [Lachnospiraceae bacterium]
MEERRAAARKKARRQRELAAQQEEKRQRKVDEQKRRREAEEREEEERILRSSSKNRKQLNPIALDPGIPTRHKLDDMHEITLYPEKQPAPAGQEGQIPRVMHDTQEISEIREIRGSRESRPEADAVTYMEDAKTAPFKEIVARTEPVQQADAPMQEAAYASGGMEAASVPEEVLYAAETVLTEAGAYPSETTAPDADFEEIRIEVPEDMLRSASAAPAPQEEIVTAPAAAAKEDDDDDWHVVEQAVHTADTEWIEIGPVDVEHQSGHAQPREELSARPAVSQIDITGMPEPVTERTHQANQAQNTAQAANETVPSAAFVTPGQQIPVRKKAVYEKPPITLLDEKKKKGGGDSDQYLKETALLLQQTLKSFGVTATVTDICQGPSVTRFELQLGEGIKVNKIVNLADDLKLNLAAQDIRIEAPIPGKAAVGIEIPNKERLPVSIRELIESQEFKKADSKLTYVVGKDISGHTIVSDIAKMPHLLVAGSTGSGKSVFTNSIILSILYEADPDEVKLILIDPKVVEFSVYNGIPHLLLPVVTDPRKANAALAWAVAEMSRRYKVFAEHNVRGIKAYNELVDEGKIPAADGQPPERLPQIVIVVDELADLMMVASKDVEDSICRIAQLARAAGIHLIIATQRPSVDVITGLIKANMPSRVALKVSSGVDSRTILDSVGAERLLGYGDMLFYPQGYSKPLRVQGAFVSDGEVQRVTEYLKSIADGNVYDEEVLNKISDMSGDGEAAGKEAASEEAGDDLDSYFDDACRFVVEKEKASSGMLQRVFKVGYNRAARIVDQMEANGVVGPEEGTKPRKVLMNAAQLEQFIQERHAKK